MDDVSGGFARPTSGFEQTLISAHSKITCAVFYVIGIGRDSGHREK